MGSRAWQADLQTGATLVIRFGHMKTNFSAQGQLHYCQLVTSVVDDAAIEQGIITPDQVTKLLHFFFSIAGDPELSPWLVDQQGMLREMIFLQVINVLIQEKVLKVKNKRAFARYLLEKGPLQQYQDEFSVEQTLCRSLHPLKRRSIQKKIE